MSEASTTTPPASDVAATARQSEAAPSRTLMAVSEADPGAQERTSVSGPGVDASLQKRVKQHASNFRRHAMCTLHEAWRLGEALREAKSQVRHGHWLPWLEQFQLTPRTAQRLMAFREKYPEIRQASHFGTVAEAMRALAPPPELDRTAPGESAATRETPARRPRLTAGPRPRRTHGRPRLTTA